MNTHYELTHLVDAQAIASAFPVMKELRPHLQDAATFSAQVLRQHAQGYRLLAAKEEAHIVGLAGYRLQENLLYGRFIYVDDLVVQVDQRRAGLGAVLLDAVRDEAKRLECQYFVLDTGLHMALAQRFYYRNGLLAKGMHFVQPLQEAA